MHETTKALLEAAKAYGPVNAENDGKETTLLLDLAVDWWHKGCPDLDAPEPDRLAELEARLDIHSETFAKVSKRLDALTALETGVKALAERHAETAERLGAVSGWVKILNEQHALHGGELSELRTSTASGLMRLTDRIKALEPNPTPPPEPARFVPTEPGWYWMRLTDGQVAVRWYDASAFAKGLTGWLAPVAPYAPPTRTEREARRDPRRGDRWLMPEGDHYTLTYPLCGTWYAVTRDGHVPCHCIGEPHETYLGNFAHELEAP